ncbi:CBS domain-containing protein [Couchioplanes caeruleus]|uniref:CBS domain-containing protein n=1 Tax=Couchioplanes caeruleus TaxID=56438 RepID=UPI000A0458EB|nr:CBS domain-containing protein [Couchioplanes caeruleus]
MRRDVVTVAEDCTYDEVVRLLTGHRVSALPVVDRFGHVRGVVSEADLLPRLEAPTG